MPKPRSSKPLHLLPVMHIYCEGEKTEPHYIKSYISTKFPGDRRRDVIRVERTRKNTPVQLVDVAVAHKKSRDCPDHDVFWVVYDRESTTKYSDELHKRALDKAKANDIKIAISNVCFEVWLYLHFQKNTTPFSCYDDFISSSKFRNHLVAMGISHYEKGNQVLFSKLSEDQITSARRNAASMNQISLDCAAQGVTSPYKLNPYTDIHLLLDDIDSFA